MKSVKIETDGSEKQSKAAIDKLYEMGYGWRHSYKYDHCKNLYYFGHSDKSITFANSALSYDTNNFKEIFLNIKHKTTILIKRYNNLIDLINPIRLQLLSEENKELCRFEADPNRCKKELAKFKINIPPKTFYWANKKCYIDVNTNIFKFGELNFSLHLFKDILNGILTDTKQYGQINSVNFLVSKNGLLFNYKFYEWDLVEELFEILNKETNYE